MASREKMLEEALRELRSVCFDRRDALTEFERLGELYYQEFGRLRPGKDDPGRDSNDPENVAQYEAWSKARTEVAFDLAERALSTPAEPRTVEPLTNADVVEGWRTTEALRDDYGWTSCEWFQAGVRFAQRHYGIGLVLAGGEQG